MINTNTPYNSQLTPGANYVSMEVQHKTKYLLEIWRAIDNSTVSSASIQGHLQDEILINLLKLVEKVFPKEVRQTATEKNAKMKEEREFINYIAELIKVAEAQRDEKIEKALGEPVTDSLGYLNTDNKTKIVHWGKSWDQEVPNSI